MATIKSSLRPAPRRIAGKNAEAPPPAGRSAPRAGAADGSTADLIARRIEDDIVLGRRHPRERLIEQDLGERFKTHRGDVRLALFELEKRGLVQRIPNRGAIVRDLTPKEVAEIYSVREELEVMAVRVLPLPVPKAAIGAIEALQRDHTKAVAAGDLLAVYHSNVRFHRLLYGLCGNACLIETIEALAQKVSGIRCYAYADPGALEEARRDHLAIIDALRHSRRADLIRLVRRHLEPAARAYIRAYRQRFGDASG
jgi:DNA-binding GntR family transcriptional regulator